MGESDRLVDFCDSQATTFVTLLQDYFDPSWVTVDRILEISDDEDVPEIVMDPKDPNFEEGTGRQFYIKWINKGYEESTYEFERDLILNEVEYKDALSSYEKRSAKPSRQNMSTFKKQRDTGKKKLYKIFGDRVNMAEDEKEKIVKDYQDALQATKWENGGQLRDYQAEGVSWMISNHINGRSSILADEMGEFCPASYRRSWPAPSDIESFA